MSIQSKARRDARRRKEQREHNRARAGAPAIEPHAELRDADGKLLAFHSTRTGSSSSRKYIMSCVGA